MALEREIKLRFDSADEAREKILALGATPLLGRRLQEDCLFDTADERLRLERATLRVRCESGKALLTFKGTVLPGVIKVREEHET
ncbi:MAG: CYTH domain-containing protein, partial [Vicinamibacterales bacterium]